VMVLIIVASLVLAWRHRDAFAPVLRARTAPVSSGVRAVEVGMGLVFVASGVMGLLGRTPPASTAGAALMLEGLAAAGYFLPLLGAVQIAAGLALVVRRFVGLALLALAPMALQIIAYRLYVATPGTLVAALAITAGQVGLLSVHRDLFASFFAGPPASPRLAVSRAATAA
jgi:hypothetical protein